MKQKRKRRQARKRRALLRQQAESWLRHMDRRTMPEPRSQSGTGGIPDAIGQERTT